MNWVRVWILLSSVLVAQGATPNNNSNDAGNPHATDKNAQEIAEARDAVRQATSVLGENHPLTAMLLRNLALAMQQAGYSNYADLYAHQSLAILEKHFGPGDVSLVPVLNVLTESAVSQARYGEARDYAERAVAIGPDATPHYGTALHNLGAVFQAQGEFQKAAEYYRRALAVRQKELPAGHPYIQITRAALKSVARKSADTTMYNVRDAERH